VAALERCHQNGCRAVVFWMSLVWLILAFSVVFCSRLMCVLRDQLTQNIFMKRQCSLKVVFLLSRLPSKTQPWRGFLTFSLLSEIPLWVFSHTSYIHEPRALCQWHTLKKLLQVALYDKLAFYEQFEGSSYFSAQFLVQVKWHRIVRKIVFYEHILLRHQFYQCSIHLKIFVKANH